MAEVIQYTLGMSNGFFVRDRGLIAVDCGSELGREPFLRVCEEHGIAPRDIGLLVVSHGHADHYVNMDEMRAVTGAPLMCHKNAERNLRETIYPDVRARNRVGRGILAQVRSEEEPVPILPPMAPDLLVQGTVDLEPWGISGRLVETPGHSPSCMSVILESDQAIVGDLIVADPVDGSVCLAYFCSIDDIEAANEQVFASVEYLLAHAETFYSGHGGPFTHDEVTRALDEARAEAHS